MRIMRSSALLAAVLIAAGRANADGPAPEQPWFPTECATSAAAILARLNALRCGTQVHYYEAEAGAWTHRRTTWLDAVAYHPSLCDGAQKHARYLLLNCDPGKGEHDERPGLAGFSEEGKKAATSGILSVQQSDHALANAILSGQCEYRHRLYLLSPDLGLVGLGLESDAGMGGFGKSVFVLNFDIYYPSLKQTLKTSFLRVVNYPPDGTSDACRAYLPENPQIEGEEEFGLPVTVQFFGPAPEGCSGRLWEVRAKGDKLLEVPVLLSAPGAVLGAGSHYDTIALLPRQTLKEDTRYKYQVAATVGGRPFQFEAAFATGKRLLPFAKSKRLGGGRGR